MYPLEVLQNHEASPIIEISRPDLKERKVRLLVKREELLFLEPHLGDRGFCGNKWRKLKYNLLEARRQSQKRLLTFGGAFSNHIAAVASAGQLFDFDTIGIIRGEMPKALNATLEQAQRSGMQLHFIDRASYRQKRESGFLESLQGPFGPFYSLPEGGTNQLALQGCSEIIEELETQLEHLPDYVCLSCGTGGTLAGVIQGLKNRSQILGFSALKGNFHTTEIQDLFQQYALPVYPNWQIQTDYHFGGFAKFDSSLISFINRFKLEFQIQLEPIYTGKLFFGIFDLIEKGYFKEGSTILAIHTGGLQGIRGFNQRFEDLIIT